MDEQRDFKGIWIPAEVWLDERLTALDKIILMEIDSLSNESGCYASNEYLAEFCKCSATKVSTSVSLLVKLGLVAVESFDGRKRKLKSCLTKSVRQPYKKCKAALQNLEGSLTKSVRKNNSLVNKFSNNNPPLPPLEDFKGELREAVEDWLAYKEEKHQPYKPTGLKSLMTQIRNAAAKHGDSAVANIIRESMSNNYQGILFDRLERRGNDGAVRHSSSNRADAEVREEFRDLDRLCTNDYWASMPDVE